MTYEVDTNGRDVGFGVGVIGEPQEQTRLSDTRVTDEKEFEEVIVSGVDLVRKRSGGHELLSMI